MDTGYRLLVFDLDGTLIDSKEDLAVSINYALSSFGFPILSHRTIASYVGNGATRLVQRSLPPGREEELAAVLSVFLAHYGSHLLDTTVPYPGVRESLEEWGGTYRMAVLTNKPIAMTWAILDGLGLSRHFGDVYGGDSFPNKKPHPEGLLHIMETRRTRPPETLMVGDSANDVLAGKAAGAATCGVTYGLGADDFGPVPPDFVVDRFPDLFARIRLKE